MKAKVPDVLEKGRVRRPDVGYFPGEWFGAFVVKGPGGRHLRLLAGKGDPGEWAKTGWPEPPWDHVSVTVVGSTDTPTWAEMDWVKRLCWDDEEAVMQLHPPRSMWVNNHPGCLHLWKPVGVDVPLPPMATVGIQSFGVLTEG